MTSHYFIKQPSLSETITALLDCLHGHVLHWASFQNPSANRDAIITYILRNVDPNVMDTILRESLLHTAISKTDFSLIEMLLKHPAIDLQLTDYFGRSVETHITMQIDALNIECKAYSQEVEHVRAIMASYRPGFLHDINRQRVVEFTQKIVDKQLMIALLAELNIRLSSKIDACVESTSSVAVSAGNAS